MIVKLYKVQVGAFLAKWRAESLSTKLITSGLKPIIIKDGLLYKVQVGAYSYKENAEKMVQTLVSRGYAPIIKEIEVEQKEDVESTFRVCPINFFESNESLFGDCTVVIEYEKGMNNVLHAVLIDTAISSASNTVINKLRGLGVKKLDAVVLSHAHGDHYGGLTAILKTFDVDHLYLPDCTQLDKYQKSYGNAIRNQEKKAKSYKIPVTYLAAGSGFTVGGINCECIFQANASNLSEHDSHHFVNNQSIATMFTLGGVLKFLTMGDLQNEANNLMVKQIKDQLPAHIVKCSWHGDGNATNSTLASAVRPKYVFHNYHHKESKGGRGNTRKKYEAVGAKVLDNWTYGDIYFDYNGSNLTVTCSKTNYKAVENNIKTL